MEIGIIGIGLIGGTIAKTLNKKHTISAYDMDKKSLDFAVENKIINKAYYDLKSFLENNKVIYICIYPNYIFELLESCLDMIQPKTLFIEISGVKRSLIAELSKLEKRNFDIVYTHPIAGKELAGVQNSDEKIFKDANYAIINDVENINENIKITENLAKDMGFKNISYITAEEHDEIIAYSSQLTHIISMALVNSYMGDLNLSHLSGDSYRDLTRISNINISLWYYLFVMNKDWLLKKISDFQVELEAIKTALSNENFVHLSILMAKASSLHQKYLKGN